MEYAIYPDNDAQVEVLASIAVSGCEEHLGQFYKLPDGREVEYDELKDWLLDNHNIDLNDTDKWMWWLDFTDAYDHYPWDEEPEEDMTDEDYSRILDDLFEDEN